MISSLIPQNLLKRILTIIPPNCENGNDMRSWAGSSSGELLVPNTYSLLDGVVYGVDHENCKLLWKLGDKFDNKEKKRS